MPSVLGVTIGSKPATRPRPPIYIANNAVMNQRQGETLRGASVECESAAELEVRCRNQTDELTTVGSASAVVRR
jgi:hypothetical protein